MKIILVSGSQRSNSQSIKATRYIEKQLQQQDTDLATEVLELATINLPLWNENLSKGGDEWKPWQQIAASLRDADGFVFLSPEWHGMATPAMKNFLLLSSANELGHKPAMLASVSASRNGVYPISEMRLTGGKNNHVCFIPDHLIFREVGSLITDELECTNEWFLSRTQYTVKQLLAYADALKAVRAKGFPHSDHASGM